MKKIFIPILLIATIISVAEISCSKKAQGRTDDAPMLAPANIDINAGTWKPILLTGPTEFPVAAPAAVTTPGYIAELNEIKGYQQKLTAEQQAKIKYWGAGAVLRLNELMRELVANIICLLTRTQMELILFRVQPIHLPIHCFLLPILPIQHALMLM